MAPSPDSPSVRALIFDMDDLLVASASAWKAAEQELLGAIGQAWSPELALRYKGMNAPDVARVIHETFRPARPLADCQRLMRAALIRHAGANTQPMPGAVELVRRVTPQAPAAVASGSPLEVVEAAMQRLGVRDCFAVMISSESVRRGKPHPDVFLAAASALQTPPAECLVFEDSLIGVQAARAAGMRCFAVPSGNREPIRLLADRVFRSLADIAVTDLFA